MPFSFTEIEKEKSLVIGFAFIFITVVYFLTAYLLLLVTENWFFPITKTGFIFPSFNHTIIVLLAAIFIAIMHWFSSTNNIISRMSREIGAGPLDQQDIYHQYFKNIVEEVSVATGGRKIEPMIIRSASLNAFALADFSGREVIGITEGLLSCLNRAQIEAVVGHEAAHIASGDCLPTTILCSLGEIYEASLSRLNSSFRNTSGKGGAFVLIIFLILFLTGLISKMLRCFLSREREFRADAAAVRLTRNPLALAEALKLISQKWRGQGTQGENIQSIFIVNPQFDQLDEREGSFADLFSTHPPVKKRVSILLSLAHLDDKALELNLMNFNRVSPVAKPEFIQTSVSVPEKWSVLKEGKWAGPFSFNELKVLKGLFPTQWIRPEGQGQVEMICDRPELKELFSQSTGDRNGFSCPICKTVLSEVNYEGCVILKCSYCAGVFIENDKISRVLIRHDYLPSEEVIRMANLAIKSKNEFWRKNFEQKSVWSRDCPKCKSKMHQQFYNYSYPVEVDCCINCLATWFDKDELEILQYIYENRKGSLYEADNLW